MVAIEGGPGIQDYISLEVFILELDWASSGKADAELMVSN